MKKKRRLSSYKCSPRNVRASNLTRATPMRKTLLGLPYGAGKIPATILIVVFFCLRGFCQSPSPPETEHRIDSILGQMTIEEKIDLLGGVDDFYVRGVPRLGVPRFRMADGPLGVRNYGPATTMAGGIALAATWNPALAE